MNNDGCTRSNRAYPKSHISWIISFKRKKLSMIQSESYSKKFFMVIAFLHFAICWILGIFVVVGFYLQSILSLEYQLLAIDFKLGMDIFDVFISNPSLLYSTFYSNPYINLPAFMLYVVVWFFPFHQMLALDIYQLLIIYALSMVLWNMLNCYLIFKIIKNEKVQALLGKSFLKNPFILMSIYLASSLFHVDYFVGQDDSLVASFLLLGLYYYVNEKEHLAYFTWGIGINFKITLAIYIFLFILHGPLKKFLKNLGFLALSQIPNLVMFVIWPTYLSGFIGNNIFRLNTSLLPNTPANLAQFLFVFFNIDISISEIFIISLILPFNLYILIEYKKSINMFDKFMIIALLSFNLVPSFWGNHLIITFGMFLIWAATWNPKFNASIRYLKTFLVIPYLSLISWLIFPFYSFLFLGVLIWLDFLILFAK